MFTHSHHTRDVWANSPLRVQICVRLTVLMLWGSGTFLDTVWVHAPVPQCDACLTCSTLLRQIFWADLARRLKSPVGFPTRQRRVKISTFKRRVGDVSLARRSALSNVVLNLPKYEWCGCVALHKVTLPKTQRFAAQEDCIGSWRRDAQKSQTILTRVLPCRLSQKGQQTMNSRPDLWNYNTRVNSFPAIGVTDELPKSVRVAWHPKPNPRPPSKKISPEFAAQNTKKIFFVALSSSQELKIASFVRVPL